MTRIAMWSGPRNLSTAMMRSWEHRADTEVLDEPLYAAYLSVTGLDHPGRDEIITAGPTDYDDAIAACVAAPTRSAISYQKHMAHHLLPGVDREWLDELHNYLLLRDPRRVLASYTQVRAAVTLEDIGFPQQVDIFDWVRERTGGTGPIPEGMAPDAALRNRAYGARHDALAAQVKAAAAEWQGTNGYVPPYWVLVELARALAASP